MTTNTTTTTTTTRATRNRRRRTTLALSLAGALALSACGSSDDDRGIASIEGATEDDAPAIDPVLAAADYQQCLRENGADITVGAEGSVAANSGSPAEADVIRDAIAACEHLADAAVGTFTPDPQRQAEIDDAQLRFERCMADRGLDHYPGLRASSAVPLDADAPASDPQGSGSLDDVDPDVLADALEECSAALDSLAAG